MKNKSYIFISFLTIMIELEIIQKCILILKSFVSFFLNLFMNDSTFYEVSALINGFILKTYDVISTIIYITWFVYTIIIIVKGIKNILLTKNSQ